jgi:hypothetical protein
MNGVLKDWDWESEELTELFMTSSVFWDCYAFTAQRMEIWNFRTPRRTVEPSQWRKLLNKHSLTTSAKTLVNAEPSYCDKCSKPLLFIEMMTSRNHLLNTLRRGYARAIRQTISRRCTGRYARGHLRVISESLHGRRRTHPDSWSSHSIARLQQHHGISRADVPALLSKYPHWVIR